MIFLSDDTKTWLNRNGEGKEVAARLRRAVCVII